MNVPEGIQVAVPEGMRVLFQGKAEYMREIALKLQQEGVKVASGPMPAQSWGAAAWIAVAIPEIDKAMAIHHRHLDEMVAKEGLAANDSVADFDAEETACPACGTPFQTKGTTRCPDCGLNFGG